MNSDQIPRLYAAHADSIKTDDGWVNAYYDSSRVGFWGRVGEGKFVFEDKLEDLYVKHDVDLFYSQEEAEKCVILLVPAIVETGFF